MPDSYLNSCLTQPRSLCQVFPGVAAIKTNIFIGNLSQFLMRRPRASQSPLSFFNPPKSGKVFFYQIFIGPPIPPPKKTEEKYNHFFSKAPDESIRIMCPLKNLLEGSKLTVAESRPVSSGFLLVIILTHRIYLEENIF